ncbi:ATP-dependent RNA helicase HrpA [Erwinia sp. OLTSP20]|uniref:ATP-dependent RNA helicase HrpA n=1 Tax=unclassified Erwinia TaxID=2622719 RepID=UPI000C1779BA|nr:MULTISPECIES: ATP-dependent RNA helicase HrpA [unclassified Erwinia]PIJ48584.1 ATP-dependent RNA helicase HrpA [Erwinia sp. OAMSP11]PIJ68768.1 ATP-dependent RNA helicase HrpA [Erwinia sp. OLSSP12]PIJ79332.1 ATP-dependent RNA helicase HrpA [Erwinia sp. OLCASP19]PIJ79515.1 ATP-dependent RNA helicase HrpA [Erwinia sp. OLMTSP26]PIJ81716.1 ATP-dependent RNA helicase HrpA [Erwinia sp. OLMDSP33]
MSETPSICLQTLWSQLEGLTLRDRQRLQRRLQHIQKIDNPARRAQAADEIAGEFARATQLVAARRAATPVITLADNLPVSEKQQEIAEAIAAHQVVIVAGETGSGKTTQLPKICLALGRGVLGVIGHTQPRRLAARTVAQRIAAELETSLGGCVGYKVRFNDQLSELSQIKLMTDGILLAEIQQDRLLLQYDTLIIDEAHERSLNIDFLLGYLHELLPRRPDLKVIITSATIDPQRFSRHFNNAPVIEVSGRTYPVEVRYRPVVEDADDSERDQLQAILDAVDELCAEGPGDILIFMSGEREIRDTADALVRRELPHTEILPLYARLSNAEQNKVFHSHAGRRIVLATNVAETSLTVPGIKYVIDPGRARISRYSYRTKVQRLPIESISQASANQRKGRCGRVSAGICIRLYAEDDFLSRPAFTDPEILRTNLASVILQMTALGLGDISAFPFVEAPDKRHIQDGVRLLEELGAIRQHHAGYTLTQSGRALSQLPVDPRLARMVLQAPKVAALREVMIIVAALSIQDPRERPADRQQAADEKHRRFADKDSDFMAFVTLWDYLQQQQKTLSSTQFRRQCKTDYLNYLRVREWQDVYTQLRQVVRELGLTINQQAADYRAIHTALLSGLLSHIGQKDAEKPEFTGARNSHFAIFPGSGLFRKPPRWTMVAELVETSRLWGRIAARIEPEWIEPLAQHLIKRSYSEPHWEKKQGAVMATEKVTLFGLAVVVARKVNYGQIDPVLSRELFIRHALVEGEWQSRHAFFHANQKLRRDLEVLEHKTRRRDILVDDETLFAFYDQRLGQEVVSSRHFDSWWQQAERQQPQLLHFTREMLVRSGNDKVSKLDFPDVWQQGDLTLRLSYQFTPGDGADGVTLHIPLTLLNQVADRGFEWQIPGLRQQLVSALIKSLPKTVRRNFVPAPDYAQAFLSRVTPFELPLLDALEREFRRMTGVTVARDSWQWDLVADHLKMTFRVLDENQRTLAEGKDLAALKLALKARVQQTLSQVADAGLEQQNLQQWSFGDLPRHYQQKRGGYSVKAWPALVDEKQSVAIRLFDSEYEQQRMMRAGLRRLLLLNIPSPVKYLHEKLPNKAKLGLYFNPYGKVLDVIDDCIACGVDKLIDSAGGPVWQEAAFRALHDTVRAQLNDNVVAIAGEVEQILSKTFAINKRLKGQVDMTLALALADIKAQMNGLVFRGFVTAVGWRRLPDVLRYLSAIERRLEKLAIDPHSDRARMLKVSQVQQAWQSWLNKMPPAQRDVADVAEIRWMIEELRVSYFAQQLGTPYPVSDKRVLQAMEQLSRL